MPTRVDAGAWANAVPDSLHDERAAAVKGLFHSFAFVYR